ncbi:hypothetical protein AZ78_5092 [Lysobacter capsici AZ78]|uniref:Lipoprotein n=2 Tax=Lysobacter capsici TaxID=435897 RepID=A0A108U4I4_9GAMM|nr:hypothetical protein [Lysobacter capsici]KWS02425.1 hypothetical protein AZ78_5092 [Lysobacter capsici AZ78]WND78556.1 hypothetical protein RJ610_14685 [Lysobacter capsici]WND83751.1 hypothetical protein RJ609_14695 [Lysobacter capsici]
MRFCTLSSQVRKLFAAGLALALLSGCSTTTFESPPSGTQVACDPRLVGQWLSGEWVEHGALEPRRGHEDTERMSILPKDCGLILRKTGECPEDLVGYRFSYLPDAAGGYIVATRATLATQPASCQGMPDNDSTDDNTARQGRYTILRYVVAPDRIAIHGVDTLRVARLIAAGTLPGSIENTEFGIEDGKIASAAQLDALLREKKANDEEPQIAASVKGSSRQVDALLASRKDLFFATPGAILRRDGKAPSAPPRKAVAKPSPRTGR